MPVVSAHILYVGTSAYDLRKVSSEVPHPTDPLLVLVRFQDDPRLTVTFNKAAFEAAWQASLAASGGGGAPVVVTPLPNPSTTVIATVPTASATGGLWSVQLTNGALTYTTTISAAHDGVDATVSEFGGVPGPGVSTLPVTFDADINGADLRLLAVVTGAGWTAKVKAIATF